MQGAAAAAQSDLSPQWRAGTAAGVKKKSQILSFELFQNFVQI